MPLPWLIVDGYNVIGREAPLTSLSAEDLDAARERLVSRVAGLAQGTYRAVVVFDAAGNPLADGTPHRVCGVAVIFTAAGRSADETIERLARRARERGDAVVVATSDAATQWTVLGGGAVRMSARELLEAFRERTAEDAEAAGPEGRRSMLSERIDPSTRERLARWARGE